MLQVVVIGLGAIGFACARALRASRHLRLVGLVDTDPEKQGKTLFDLGWHPPAGSLQSPESQEPGPAITDDLDEALRARPDVAILTTGSHFLSVLPTIDALLQAPVAVLSSCEELVWPRYRYPEEAAALDRRARKAGRAVLGVGVNPGFVMDKLPLVLSTMVRRVDALICTRRLDASLRRRALQAKIGATLPVAEFETLQRQGRVGHVGLAESLALLAAGLGRQVEPGSVAEMLEPVLAQAPTESAVGLIRPGHVAGIHQKATWQSPQLRLELDLTMAVGAENPRDRITIEGPVSLHFKIPGSVPGDSATVATLLNHLPAVHAAPAGLRSVLDLPAPGCAAGD